jgi:predicted permease
MKWGGIRAGVRRLFRLGIRTPECIRADAGEELRFHIDARVEHLVARGTSPAEARLEAERRLGGPVEDVRIALEQSALQRERQMEFTERLDSIRQDIGVTLRGLRNAPGFTATVVLTLALGVGANAAVFSVLDQIYLREPVGVAHASELRRLYERVPPSAPMNGGREVIVSPQFDYSTFAAMRAELAGRAELIAFTSSDSESIGLGESAVPARVAYVSENYFATLGIRAARGRFFASSEGAVESDPGVAILGYAIWDRAFGRDPAIVGRKIEVNKRPYVVIGVAASGFSGLELNKAELFLPLGAFSARLDRGRRPWYTSLLASYFRIVARAPYGDDRQLTAIATIVDRRFASDMRGQMPPGTQPDTSSTIVTGPIITALGPGNNPKEYAIGLRLAGVAAIVLLIACANIANLLLVRAIRRRHEVAVRLALGVSRARLMAQFLTEGIVLAALGGSAALLVAAWGGTALRATILPTTHWATPALDLNVLVFTLAVAVLTGIAAALLPALQGSRVDIVKSLKPGSRGHESNRSRVRSMLLATQTALSLVLLVGAGLFVRSLQKLHDLPIGYASDELAFASVDFDGFANHDAERKAALAQAADRVATAPGVVGVALAEHTPMGGATMTGVYLPGIDSAMSAPYYNSVSPQFFRVAGLHIVAGRAFTADDRRGPGGAVVVNETMAKEFWRTESPLGKCIILDKKTAACSTVVGIVEDGRIMRILETKQPQYFQPLRAAVDSESVAPGAIIVRTQGGKWYAADAIARSELRRLIPGAKAVSFSPMSKSLERELRPWRLGATLFTAFGLLALLVATVGVYGVIAYSFSQRTHELGVRTALGASARDTYQLVLGEAFRLTAIGVAMGVVLALALGKLIASLLYATSARDPLVIAIAASVLVAVGTGASLLPAWRAARTDPMIALRAD